MLKPRKAIDGTRGLTNPERGVYWDLINLMYLMGGPVHDDDRYLAGHCNLGVAAYRRLRKSLIEKGKLHQVNGPKLIANGVEHELNLVETMLELRRKSGQSGGKASGKSRSENKENKDLGEASASTSAKPLSSPSPAYIDSVPNGTGASAPEDLFEEPPPEKAIDPAKVAFDCGVDLLGRYGYKPAAARKLVGKWRKQVNDPDLVAVFLESAKSERSNIVEFVEGSIRARDGPGNGRPKRRSALMETLYETG